MEELKGIDKINKVLELQREGLKQSEIALAVGHEGKDPARALRNFMRSWGYRAIGTKFPEEPNGEKINKNKKSNTTKSNTRAIKEPSDILRNDTKEQKSNTLSPEVIEKLLTIADNYDNIMSITSSNTSSVTNAMPKESIHNACKDAVGVSIKVDHEVWKKFKKYAKVSDYKQQDLITVALEMIMKSDL